MILVNGHADEKISVADRALHYGDGLFETIAVSSGHLLAWDRHILRLQAGCERLSITCPSASLLRSEADKLCHGVKLGVFKLIVSRGLGGRGYRPPESSQTSRIVSLHDWPYYPEEYASKGVKVTVSKLRLGHSPMLAGLKHLNRLEQVLLRSESWVNNYPEAIVLDINENVIEGSMSNIFIVKNGSVFTPDLTDSGVAGVIRAAIIELVQKQGSICTVRKLELADVLEADEIFFCNSIAGVWPVVAVNDRNFQLGPLTRQIQQQLVTENLIIL